MGVKCLNPTQLPYEIKSYTHTITALDAIAGVISLSIPVDKTKILSISGVIYLLQIAEVIVSLNVGNYGIPTNFWIDYYNNVLTFNDQDGVWLENEYIKYNIMVEK